MLLTDAEITPDDERTLRTARDLDGPAPPHNPLARLIQSAKGSLLDLPDFKHRDEYARRITVRHRANIARFLRAIRDE